MIRFFTICAAAITGAALLTSAPAEALSMKECSAKYKEAQKAGTLKGQTWNQFRAAECKEAAEPAAAAPAADAKATKEATKEKDKSKTTPAAKTETPKAAPAAAGAPVFPPAVDKKYSSESEGKARMHTCLDQYKANKANNGNGGLRWIQKGGGYYSECVKHLKG